MTGRAGSGDLEIFYRKFESDMFEAATLEKARALNPRLVGIELAGSHDLAGDNPAGLVSAINRFPADAVPA
jgi:hypothetical protein